MVDPKGDGDTWAAPIQVQGARVEETPNPRFPVIFSHSGNKPSARKMTKNKMKNKIKINNYQSQSRIPINLNASGVAVWRHHYIVFLVQDLVFRRPYVRTNARGAIRAQWRNWTERRIWKGKIQWCTCGGCPSVVWFKGSNIEGSNLKVSCFLFLRKGRICLFIGSAEI